jgi:hypothetical protein
MRRRHTDGMDLAMGGCTALLDPKAPRHDARTTSIYTAAHAEDLSAALADAGAL